MNMQFIRTYFPHWAKHSGYHRFVKYLPSDWIIDVKSVPLFSHDLSMVDSHNATMLKKAMTLFPKGYEWYDLKAELNAVGKWLEKNTDIVHYLDAEHGLGFLPNITEIFKAVKPPKFAVTYHQPNEILIEHLRPELFSKIDCFVVLCNEQKQFLIEKGINSRIEVIPHGIDTNYYSPVSNDHKYGAEDGRMHLLSVGSWLRDYRTIGKVAEAIGDSNVQFHIVGSTIDNADQIPWVKIHDRLTDEALLKLYQKSDAIFLPLENATANNVILEGMACGLPIISTRLTSIEEYVTPECGFLEKNGHIEGFIEKIEYLQSNEKARQSMGVSSRKRAEELAWPAISNIYADLYQDIASEKTQRSFFVQNKTPFRVAIVNSHCDRGGAAMAAYRLNTALNMDHRSTFFCLNTNESDDVVQLFQPLSKKLQDKDYSVQRNYIDLNRSDKTDTWFSFCYFTELEPCLEKLRDYDVINLHWVAHFITPRILYQIGRLGKPIVWTLHDEHPFTGGCHYTHGCERYKTDCNACPQLRNDPLQLPHRMLHEWEKAVHPLNITVIAPSRWLADQARQSRVFRGKRIEVVPNGLDHREFFPEKKSDAKQKLGIEKETSVLLFSASNISEKRKGVEHLIEAVHLSMNDKIFNAMASSGRIMAIYLGENSLDLSRLPIRSKAMGHLDSDEEIRIVYNASDLFVIPSLEDNLPNTVMEAMACGTPVVGFDTGGIPDMVRENCGRIVTKEDSPALAREICDLIRDPIIRENYAKNCRHIVEEEYTLDRLSQNYCNLFAELAREGESNFGGKDEIVFDYDAINEAFEFAANNKTERGLEKTNGTEINLAKIMAFSKIRVDKGQMEVIRTIRESGLFYYSYYLGNYTAVRDIPMDPVVHFVLYGAVEGKNPNPLFHTTWYCEQYPEVVAAGHNPLYHYIKWGAFDRLDPSPYFSTNAYIENHPTVIRRKLNPLSHYLRYQNP